MRYIGRCFNTKYLASWCQKEPSATSIENTTGGSLSVIVSSYMNMSMNMYFLGSQKRSSWVVWRWCFGWIFLDNQCVFRVDFSHINKTKQNSDKCRLKTQTDTIFQASFFRHSSLRLAKIFSSQAISHAGRFFFFSFLMAFSVAVHATKVSTNSCWVTVPSSFKSKKSISCEFNVFLS